MLSFRGRLPFAALAGAVLALPLFAAPAGGQPTDPKTPIEVPAGQEFTITLESNPTTGFSWQLSGPLDESVVQLVGSSYNSGQPGLPGAGGEEIWTFQSVGTGETSITLEYRRPWETDQPAAETRIFSVVVGNPPILTTAGDQFSITLDANHTTGYRWQLAGPVDQTVIQLVSTTYQRSQSGLIGSGGQEVWTFAAVSVGQATITLEYERPWETDVTPAKTQTYTVVVSG